MDDIAALLRQDLQKPTPRGPRAGVALFRVSFVPLLLIGSSAAWVFHDRVQQRLVAARAGIDALTAFLLISLAAVGVAEHLYPAEPSWNYHLADDALRGLHRLGRDLVYLVVMSEVTALLIGFTSGWLNAKVASLGFVSGLRAALWPARAPFLARVALVFLVFELASYGVHRAAHRVPLLWRFHRTHHVVEELSGLKALRLHPIDNLIFYVVRALPLLLMGAGAEEVLTVSYVVCTLSILSHANVDVAETRLGWVVNLPQYHRVHHSADLADSNSNFGCHTVLWDRLFGTFRRVPVGPLRLGVEPRGPRSLWEELGWAFYRRLDPAPDPSNQ